MSAITDLLDGEKLTVKFRPKPGAELPPEDVLVRRIPICDMDGLGRAWGKPKQEVAVYCDRPADWVERLDEDSFIQIMDKGRQLNFTSFQKWWKWQADTMQAMGQGADMQSILKDTITALTAQAAGLPSPTKPSPDAKSG